MYALSEVMVIVWTLWSVAFLTTIARAMLRWKIQGKYYAEDYFAFACLVFLSGLVGVVVTVTPKFEMTRKYLLAATEDPSTPLPLPADEFSAQTITALKLMFSQMLLFWSTLWAGKFSLLVFFRRMVLGIPKYLHIWWLVFTLVMVTYLACMLSNVLTCVPLQRYWSITGCSLPNDLKRSDASIKFATAADIVADFLIMLLPLRLLFTLQISRRQKIGLACLFSLGTIVIIFAFVRLYNVTKATSQSKTDPKTLADGPVILSLWSTIEAAVATIVANLPAFRSLLKDGGDTRGSSARQTADLYARQKTHGARSNGSRSAIARDTELESLHSYEGEMGKGRAKNNGFNEGHITITKHIEVESRKDSGVEKDTKRRSLFELSLR